MDCSSPGSSVHGIPQARILERVVIPFSRGSSWPRDQILPCVTSGQQPQGTSHVHSSRQTNPCLEGYTFNLSDQDGYLPLNHRILSDLITSHKTEWVSAVTNRVATFMLQLFLSTLMWYAELCPPIIHMLKSSLSAPQNGTFFGKGVTAHVVS